MSAVYWVPSSPGLGGCKVVVMSQPQRGESTRALPRVRRKGILWTPILLLLLVLSIVGPLVNPYLDQAASRYALSAAIWDNQSVQLDGLEGAIGRDAAFKDGHFYSDKAPLQPFLGAPVYGVFRMAGGDPATVVREQQNLGLWWQSFWFAAVPLALLAVWVFRWLQRFNRKTALFAALSIAMGTILLPLGAMLFGHVLAGLFVTGSVLLLLSDRMTRFRLLGAGAMAGAAVATEYPTALAVIVITIFAVWRSRLRSFWYVLGGIPFAALLGGYHTLAFGSPLSHPYRYNVFSGVNPEQKELLQSFSGFKPDNLLRLFVSGRGFLIASPIVIVGLVGLIYIIRRRGGLERAAAIVSLAVFLSMMVVPVYWSNPWGGHSPGPRYLAPALPLLALGVAAVWSFRPLLTRLAVGISSVTMVLATFTNPLVDDEGSGGLGTWIGLASEGEFVDTVFTMALGAWGWLLHGAIVGTLGWLLWRESQRSQQMAGTSPEATTV